MRIIDEKGKLFGKINIIDFLVILLLLCILPGFYVGYRIMTKSPIEIPKGEFLEIEADCLFIKLEPELLKLISVGDKELDGDGNVLWEIVGLGQSKPYVYEFKIGGGEKIVKKDTGLMQLEVKLRLKINVINNKPYFEGEEIRVSSPLNLKIYKYGTTMAIFPTMVVAVTQINEKVEERIVDLYVTLKELDEDILKEISVGDKELDENGKAIAEILSLGSIESSSLAINLGSGNFATGQTSAKKQISAMMRLKCLIKEGDQLCFKGQRMKHQIPFEFKTDKYKAKVLVTKTFEKLSLLKERWISLQVKFTGMVPEIANAFQSGDTEKNALGKTVARISLVVKNKPSEVLVLKENGFISLNHPFHRDILASLDVRCIEKDGVYYFKNYPVKMGNNITFSSDLYSVSGLIVAMGTE